MESRNKYHFLNMVNQIKKNNSLNPNQTSQIKSQKEAKLVLLKQKKEKLKTTDTGKRKSYNLI